MGSVSIIPATVPAISTRGSSITAGWSSGFTGTSVDAALIAAVSANFAATALQDLEAQNGTIHSGNITFAFDQSTAIFTIDTGLVSFTGLPSGFLFDSLVFNCSPQGGSINSGSISFSLSGQLIQTYPYNGIANFTHDLLNGRPSLAPISFINEQFQFAFALGNLNAGGILNNLYYLYNWSLTGTYILFSFSWNIKNASTPIKQARGSLQPIRVTVQSPSDDTTTGGPNGLTTGGLDGIVADTGSGESSITINYFKLDGTLVQRTIPSTDIIIQENIILIFIINIIILQLIIDDLGGTINTTTFYITATGNGVQFSGSVPLGNLNILLVDASGMYKITEDKRNDTLYNEHNGSTFDSAIPNPFVKGGFVGG